MPYLFNLFYMALIVVASPWLLYQVVRRGKYRAGLAEKFLGRVPVRQGNRPCLWLHAVSVGEVNLLAPLLAEIRRTRPDWECVISATSVTGYTLARKKYADYTVCYCPLDFSWAVRAAMRRIRPDCLVLAELELWPNLIRAAREAASAVAIINGRLSEHSFRGYQRARLFLRPLVEKIDLVAVQNEEFAARFRALGARDEAVRITGSIKFDGAQTSRANPATVALAKAAGFATDDIVFLAGSTQQPEEALALTAYKSLRDRFPRLRLVLVPRHPERFEEVAALLAASEIPWQRRSKLNADGVDPQARVLMVDTVGELGAWWGTAHIAFVGGSIHKRGGQNMIEPAAYGAAVSFGPNTRNFRDIVAQLLAAKGAVVVRDGAEMTAFVERCLVDSSFASNLGSNARGLVARQLGATARTLAGIDRLMDRPQGESSRARSAA
ncbi:MAG TPA: 3-deoxy-D-manno-octulosonic acid transferase [Pirellulales bacterium]|nr:3-deoxy-D-manno-octulosonic acid transferase [Pirellulales bacterium]